MAPLRLPAVLPSNLLHFQVDHLYHLVNRGTFNTLRDIQASATNRSKCRDDHSCWHSNFSLAATEAVKPQKFLCTRRIDTAILPLLSRSGLLWNSSSIRTTPNNLNRIIGFSLNLYLGQINISITVHQSVLHESRYGTKNSVAQGNNNQEK